MLSPICNASVATKYTKPIRSLIADKKFGWFGERKYAEERELTHKGEILIRFMMQYGEQIGKDRKSPFY